jgi:branched-chain amino acid transport system substrate-binding protein
MAGAHRERELDVDFVGNDVSPSETRRRTMSTTRRMSGVVAVLAAAAAIAGCGSSSNDGGGAGGQSGGSKAPIKLGGVLTISGPLAEIGQSHQAGAKLAVDEINQAGGIAGRKLQLDVKDEQADPDATVSGVRDLLSSDAKLIFGGTTDSDCLAAAPLVNSSGGVLMGTSCQSNLLQGDKFVPAFFEIAPTNYMLSMATAHLAADSFGDVGTWDGVGPDYEFGHEVWDSFKQDLAKLRQGTVFRKGVFVPLTETRFKPYITSLLSGLPSDSADKNGLFMSTFSATTAGLAKQGKPFQLFERYKTVLNLGGSTPTAEALGADTPPLYFIYDYYDGAYDNPTNTKFVDAFKAANSGKKPNAWNYEGYTAVMAYKAAIEKAGTDDPAKVRDALAGLEVDTPKGKLTFRAADHLLQTPVTVWKVEGDKGAPGGFKVSDAHAIPADQVLPPARSH